MPAARELRRPGVLEAAAAAVLLAACAAGPPAPATLDTANDTCGQCRMAVSDRRFAAQIVAPGEEPRFFDDLGCLRDYIAGHPELPDAAAAFVADHRTGEWVAAADALFSRKPSVATPMASGLLAHRDARSRDSDPEAAGAQAVPAAELLGPFATKPEGE